MVETTVAADGPDHLSSLLARMVAGDRGGDTGPALYTAVHEAVFPMCLAMLGDPDTARDAEQETLRRLLEHLSRRDPRGPGITHGTAYVRQIARNVCNDLGRRATESRRERDADLSELGELAAPAPDPAIADMTPPGATHHHAVRDVFGYRSKQLLDDLAGLSPQELRVLALRVQGLSYAEIAQRLGAGLTAATAQTQGERAMHHLRGRVHEQIWRQEPLGTWTMPHCPVLARLKAEVQRRLTSGTDVTVTLYREIGRHVDPHPNRSRARGDTPACQACAPELKRCESNYMWLLGAVPPLIGLLGPPQTAPPPLTPAAHTAQGPAGAATSDGAARHHTGPQQPGPGDAPPARAAGRRSPRRARVLASLLVVVAIVLLTTGVVAAVRAASPDDPPRALPGGQPPTSPGDRGPAGTPATGATPAADALPEVCTLVTATDVTNILGGDPFLQCRPGPTVPAGTPRTSSNGNFDRSTVESHGVREFAGFTLDMVGSPPSDTVLSDCGPTGETVPGLGDANCHTVDSVGATVAVQKGHLFLKIVFGLVNGSRDAVIRLARLVVDRLPSR